MTTLPDDAQMAANAFRSRALIATLASEANNPEEAEALLLALFVTLTRHLAEGGYPPDQLAKEALHHATEAAGR